MKGRTPARSCARKQNTIDKGEFLSKGRSRLFEWFGSGFGSVFIHFVLLLFLVLIVRGGTGGVGTGRQTDEIGVVFSDSIDLNSHNSSVSNETTSDTEAQLSESIASDLPTNNLHEILESYLPTNEIGLAESSGGASSQVMISEATSRAGNGSSEEQLGQAVGFSGARGAGRKFTYVIDRSDSMGWNGGAPMRRAVSDAIASVQSLDSKRGAAKFQVLVFNHEVNVFDSGVGLIDVTPANKARCVRFLKSLVPTGGTSSEAALMAGIRMRPDVVFFLTDADEELTEQTLERVQTLRRQCKVRQICVIEFRKSTDPVKKTYKRLAAENGGTYVVRNIDAL